MAVQKVKFKATREEKPFIIKTEIDPSRVVDLFITACEGGSNYWCKSVDPHKPESAKDAYWAMLNGFHLEELDKDAAEVFVSRKDIENALQIFQVECPAAYTDFLNNDADAMTADCFLQLCAFGKIIYG